MAGPKGPAKFYREALRLGDVGSEDPVPGIAPGVNSAEQGAIRRKRRRAAFLHRSTTLLNMVNKVIGAEIPPP